MENRFKKNKWYQRYSKIIFLSLFVMFFIATSIFIIYKGLDIVKTRDIVYVNNSDIDYSVYLKDNNYFNTPYLGKNEKYIASLIDKINIKFNYTLNAEEAMKGKYSYNIISTVVVKEQNKDAALYSPNFTCKDSDILVEKIGLLSADEYVFSGGSFLNANTNIFINDFNTSNDWWNLSPAYYDSNQAKVGLFIVQTGGSITDWPNTNTITNSAGIRPVITVNGNYTISGSGTSSDPYYFN